MTTPEVRQHMIDVCVAKMKHQQEQGRNHKGLTEEQLVEKATKWADQKIQKDAEALEVKEARAKQQVSFTTTYTLVLTPSMIAAGEIGIEVRSPQGNRVAYTPFDFTKHEFLPIIEPDFDEDHVIVEKVSTRMKRKSWDDIGDVV